jgi:hypothetical protein
MLPVAEDADRAVGEEASRSREYLREPSVQDRSIAIGQRERAAYVRLRDALLEASTEGWDGEGGLAAQELSFVRAKYFIQGLPSYFPIPDIDVSSQGHALLEWHFGPRAVLTVDVAPSGLLSYASLLGRNTSYGTESFSGGIPRIIVLALDRLLSSARL